MLEIIDISSKLLGGISAIVISVVAIWGLNRWRAQLKGTTEYQVAQRCLRAIIATRHAIQRCRSPFVYRSEWAGRETTYSDIKEDPRWAEVHNQAYAYSNRLEEVQKAKADLEQAAQEAEVLWGDWVPKKLEPLNECIRELSAAFESYFQLRSEALGAGDVDNDPGGRELGQEWRRILYAPRDSDDAYAKKLDAAIESAKAAFRPHLK